MIMMLAAVAAGTAEPKSRCSGSASGPSSGCQDRVGAAMGAPVCETAVLEAERQIVGERLSRLIMAEPVH
jgi:hypothetical protein